MYFYINTTGTNRYVCGVCLWAICPFHPKTIYSFTYIAQWLHFALRCVWCVSEISDYYDCTCKMIVQLNHL